MKNFSVFHLTVRSFSPKTTSNGSRGRQEGQHGACGQKRLTHEDTRQKEKPRAPGPVRQGMGTRAYGRAACRRMGLSRGGADGGPAVTGLHGRTVTPRAADCPGTRARPVRRGPENKPGNSCYWKLARRTVCRKSCPSIRIETHISWSRERIRSPIRSPSVSSRMARTAAERCVCGPGDSIKAGGWLA